jgi:hypothetical protein
VILVLHPASLPQRLLEKAITSTNNYLKIYYSNLSIRMSLLLLLLSTCLRDPDFVARLALFLLSHRLPFHASIIPCQSLHAVRGARFAGIFSYLPSTSCDEPRLDFEQHLASWAK